MLSVLQLFFVLFLPKHHARPSTTERQDMTEPPPLIPAQNRTMVEEMRLEHNVSRLLDNIAASHDRRIRPRYGGPPIEVNITAHITTISAVSEVSMDFTLDLYLRQIWHDPRLSWESSVENSLTIGVDYLANLWTPDTFFPNEKKSFFHEATSHNSFLRIDNHGNVLRSIRLTVTANCPMNLQSFPLDVQECALEIESYGYSTRDIVYHWHNSEAVKLDENVHLAHFTIGPHWYIERAISLSTGNYSRLTAFFTFKRNIGFYLIQIYFPSSLIVVISWVSFYLNREAVQARVAIGEFWNNSLTPNARFSKREKPTLSLGISCQRVDIPSAHESFQELQCDYRIDNDDFDDEHECQVRSVDSRKQSDSSLPKVSYVKSLDIFLGVCFFIVFASLLEYAAIGYLMKRNRSMANASPVQYYETGDGVLKREPSAKKKKKRSEVKVQMDGSEQMDQRIPLLAMVQMVPIQGAFKPKQKYFCGIRPAQVDLFSRIAFPSFFIVFQLIYWGYYLRNQPTFNRT